MEGELDQSSAAIPPLRPVTTGHEMEARATGSESGAGLGSWEPAGWDCFLAPTVGTFLSLPQGGRYSGGEAVPPHSVQLWEPRD